LSVFFLISFRKTTKENEKINKKDSHKKIKYNKIRRANEPRSRRRRERNGWKKKKTEGGEEKLNKVK
jgi:hypothetical protein